MNAVQPSFAAGSTNVLSGGAIALSVIGTLMLIIMLMVLLAWIARRSGLARCSRESQGAVSLVASKPLGSRERLVVVDVGEQRLVLGVTATQISCLTVQDRPEVPEQAAPSAAFPAMLDNFLHKYRSGGEQK